MGAPADAGELERCRAAGVAEALHWLPSAGLSEIETELEAYEGAVASFRGENQ